MQEQAHSTHDVQPGGRKRLADRNSDSNGRYCADSVCECRSKRLAPTMCSLAAAGSVWPPGIWIPRPGTDCADSVCECRSKCPAPTMYSPAARQEASDRQEFGCNSRDCADSLCECRSKRTAPTMCSPAAGSVWSSGIRMPTVEIALILCVKAEARTLHPRSPSVKKQIRNEWDICNSWLFCSLMKRMCRSVPSLSPLLSISPTRRLCLSFYFYVKKSPPGAPLLWLLLHVTGSMMFVGCQLYSVPTVSRGERSCDSSNVHTR